MFTISLHDDADIKNMLMLLSDMEMKHLAFSYNNGTFSFQDKPEYEKIYQKFYELDEEVSGLANAIAGDILDKKPGNQPNKSRPEPISSYSKPASNSPANMNRPEPKKPVSPNDKAQDDIATNLDVAMNRDPRLKRDLENAAKKGGLSFEDIMVRAVVGDYLRERKNITETKADVRLIFGRLVETALDDLSNKMVEYFVALKAQKVKSISLKKLAAAIRKSDIDIDPYQDMQFFIDLVSSLPVVKDVNVAKDRVNLETPPQPGDEPEQDTDKKSKPTDPVEDAASKKALDNVKNDDIDVDQKDMNLFKEDISSSSNMEVLTFELAETLADKLSASGWDGSDDQRLKLGVESVIKEYSDIDVDLLMQATIDMYNQFYSITDK